MGLSEFVRGQGILQKRAGGSRRGVCGRRGGLRRRGGQERRGQERQKHEQSGLREAGQVAALTKADFAISGEQKLRG